MIINNNNDLFHIIIKMNINKNIDLYDINNVKLAIMNYFI